MDVGAQNRSNKPCIIISPRQRGNPLIRHLTNVVPVEGETHYDYKITEEIQHLRSYRIKNPFIICQIDITDPQEFIDELTVATFALGYRILLSWSARESAAILEILRIDGQKGLELLSKKRDSDHLQTVKDIISCVKSVNGTDASVLSKRFDTVKHLMHITTEDVDRIHGLGKRKVKALLSAFSDDFF